MNLSRVRRHARGRPAQRGSVRRVGLIVLLAANVLVAAAWLGRDRLVAAGWLVLPPSRIDLPAQPLPPISVARGETPIEKLPPASTSPAESAESVPEPAVVTSGLCQYFGPFDTRSEVDDLTARIAFGGGSARIVEESLVGEPDYLVYVEPAASRSIAHRTWLELVGQGVDAFVIPSGPRQNGVSVGVFTLRELAIAQRDRVAELGYPVAMRRLRRSHSVYAVVAHDAPPEGVVDVPAGPCEDDGQVADVAGAPASL